MSHVQIPPDLAPAADAVPAMYANTVGRVWFDDDMKAIVWKRDSGPNDPPTPEPTLPEWLILRVDALDKFQRSRKNPLINLVPYQNSFVTVVLASGAQRTISPATNPNEKILLRAIGPDPEQSKTLLQNLIEFAMRRKGAIAATAAAPPPTSPLVVSATLATAAPAGPMKEPPGWVLKEHALRRHPEVAAAYKLLVIGGKMTDTEFWSSRRDLLRSAAIARDFDQKRSAAPQRVANIQAAWGQDEESAASAPAGSNSGTTDAGTAVQGTGPTFVFTPALVRTIFVQFPRVRQLHAAKVPHEISEQEFWKKFVLELEDFNSDRPMFFPTTSASALPRGGAASLRLFDGEDAVVAAEILAMRETPRVGALRLVDLESTREDFVHDNVIVQTESGERRQALDIARRCHRLASSVLFGADVTSMSPGLKAVASSRNPTDAQAQLRLRAGSQPGLALPLEKARQYDQYNRQLSQRLLDASTRLVDLEPAAPPQHDSLHIVDTTRFFGGAASFLTETPASRPAEAPPEAEPPAKRLRSHGDSQVGPAGLLHSMSTWSPSLSSVAFSPSGTSHLAEELRSSGKRVQEMARSASNAASVADTRLPKVVNNSLHIHTMVTKELLKHYWTALLAVQKTPPKTSAHELSAQRLTTLQHSLAKQHADLKEFSDRARLDLPPSQAELVAKNVDSLSLMIGQANTAAERAMRRR
ncbi:hypothetical protein H696_01754 [Fonticula alba]|uniref:BSD domain-containing protein n=1 Tax=Fonticula alba TaxID=691883 RepID=A0A058ZEI5_FONAL|nr:hypothetical protein H696_01754 [Fonticula alba]KCV72361.1 hypothetical protein H696_01754 [Fonticula alba]|eukprot:XP_009493939.1 hypothetical protein H696_01754 [Fonticula alba]